MNTSSSSKRSRSSSPSALPDAFPFYEALKGHVGIFRHIFFDMMDAETRHICRAVASSWMNGLPALEGSNVTTQLNNWAYKNGYAHFLALGPIPRKPIPYHRLYTAVKRGQRDIVSLINAVDETSTTFSGLSPDSHFHRYDVELKIIAAQNADLPMLKLLYQINPNIPLAMLHHIRMQPDSYHMQKWVKEITPPRCSEHLNANPLPRWSLGSPNFVYSL